MLPKLPAKKDLCIDLLQTGMVMIILDARKPGVEVPSKLSNDPQLKLNLSLSFGYPVEILESGIKATLTFGGLPYDCRLPWNSIYVIFSHVTGEPHVFPSDVPSDVLAQIKASQSEDLSGLSDGSAARSIDFSKDVAADFSEQTSAPKDFSNEGQARPVLRLVQANPADFSALSHSPKAPNMDVPPPTPPPRPARRSKARASHLRVVK